MVVKTAYQVKKIPLHLIDLPEDDVRMGRSEDRINEMMLSLQQNGQESPIEVRPNGERYTVTFGVTRVISAGRLSWPVIDGIVKKCSEGDAFLRSAIENLHRADMTPLEEARVYVRLRDKFRWSVDKIGEKFGKTPGVVLRRLDLLKLPDCLQEAVHKSLISVSAAEELSRIKDLAALQYYLGYAIDNGATKDVCREWAQQWRKTQSAADRASAGGGLPPSPLETQITYTSCELCQGPVDVNKVTLLRLCPVCVEAIGQALSGQKGS